MAEHGTFTPPRLTWWQRIAQALVGKVAGPKR